MGPLHRIKMGFPFLKTKPRLLQFLPTVFIHYFFQICKHSAVIKPSSQVPCLVIDAYRGCTCTSFDLALHISFPIDSHLLFTLFFFFFIWFGMRTIFCPLWIPVLIALLDLHFDIMNMSMVGDIILLTMYRLLRMNWNIGKQCHLH